MAILSDVITSVFGAWRLAHFDARGLAYFDTSERGFWRSFLAAALIAPFYAVLAGLMFTESQPLPSPVRFAIAEALYFAVSWLAYPVVIYELTARLGCRDRFIPYIVAYNWAAVLQNALFLPIKILAVAGIWSPTVSGLVELAALAAVVAYMWFIARSALGIKPALAAGLVVLDLALSIIIRSIATGLYLPMFAG